MLIKERVIILRTIKYSEADLVVQALNSKGTRLSLFARSALKSRKRFGGGVLEPTHYVEALFEDRKSKSGGESTLYSLREASLLEDFSGLRSDYSRLQTALQLLQVSLDFSREGEADSNELFHLLGNALRLAQTSTRLDLLKLHFETKVLLQQGILEATELDTTMLRLPLSEHEKIRISDEDRRGLLQRNRALARDFLGRVDDGQPSVSTF